MSNQKKNFFTGRGSNPKKLLIVCILRCANSEQHHGWMQRRGIAGCTDPVSFLLMFAILFLPLKGKPFCRHAKWQIGQNTKNNFKVQNPFYPHTREWFWMRRPPQILTILTSPCRNEFPWWSWEKTNETALRLHPKKWISGISCGGGVFSLANLYPPNTKGRMCHDIQKLLPY